MSKAIATSSPADDGGESYKGKGKGSNPKSKVHLHAPWTSETRPNPGKRKAGYTIRDWFNVMADYTELDLREAATAMHSSAAKRAAAGQWLDTLYKQPEKAATAFTTDQAGRSLDRIYDRTVGRPKQSLEVETNDNPPETMGDYVTQMVRASVPRERWPIALQAWAEANLNLDNTPKGLTDEFDDRGDGTIGDIGDK